MTQNPFENLHGISLVERVKCAPDEEITKKYSEVIKRLNAEQKLFLEKATKEICYSNTMCDRLGINYHTMSGYERASLLVYYQSINKQPKPEIPKRGYYNPSPQFTMS